MGKKIFLILFIIIVFTTGCDFKIDDSEKRTYKGVTYEKAYTLKKKDGLRSSVYYYYLFDEDDNKFVYCVHLTAGAGKTRVYEGIWTGDLKNSATLKTIYSDEKVGTEDVTFDDFYMIDEENNKYSSSDVKTTISAIILYE